MRTDFELVFRHVPSCYLLFAPDLSIAGVSDAYLRASMTSRAIVGRTFSEVFPDHPDADAAGTRNLATSLRRVLIDRLPDRMALQKFLIRRPDRQGGLEERYWRPINVPVLTAAGDVAYIVHHVEDATDVVHLEHREQQHRSAAHTETPQSEERYLALLARLSGAVEAVPEGFALFDSADTLLLCNQVYRRLLGGAAAAECLIGRPYRELLEAWLPTLAFDDLEERALFEARRLDSRGQPTTSFDVHTRTGRSLRVLDRRTQDGGMVQTIWDLTDDERRAAELVQARIAAEAGSVAKSEFLASMSHELRTPLNAILGFAQLLTRDYKEPLSARQRQRVEHVLKGGAHLLTLINEILDLARIEAGGTTISMRPVRVASVLTEVERTLHPLAARQGISLVLAPLPPGLRPVDADRTRLMQILMNFGSNAIKYNRRGGSVRLGAVTSNEGRIRIIVQDTGVGISPEKQAKLFQPFERAGQETGPIEGTGIGLVLCKRLAELMDGNVGLHSAEGEGSEFWLELPAANERPASLGATL